MTLTRKLFFASLALAVIALGAGYILARVFPLAIAVAVLGGLWLAALLRNWNWYPSIGFIFFLIAAGVGLLAGLNPAAMLAGVAASLAAWDLAYFDRNLKAVKNWTPALDRIQRRHLARLGIVLAGGCLLAALELLIRIRLTLWVAVILGLVAVWSLVLLVQALNKSSR